MTDQALYRHRLWDEFLQAWPRERMASMTLSEYIRCGSQESFTYWLEFKLADLGSIKGGTAIKFGIFERKDPAAPAERYEWKEGLGKTAEEAYDRIHARILATVEAAERGDIDAVEAVELPSLLKWKVAFLYQNRENPVFPCIYGDNYLRGVTNLTRKATHAEAVKKLMAAYEGEEDIFDFCRCIWGDYDRWREYAPYGDFDPGLSERDWAELLADPKIATPKVRTLLVRLRAFGGTATCSQLAKAYGEETNFYNTAGQELGRHVREARRIPELSGADGPKYWAVPFLGRDVDPKTDGDVPGIFFWRLRPELAAALDVTDWVAEAGEPVRLDESSPAVSTIELPASIPAPRADGRYWWLNANPKEWSYTDVDLGVEFKYTVTSESGAKRRIARYFTEARPGDVVVCYQTTPYQEVVGMAVVSSAANEKDIGFTQFVRFSNPVSRDTLQRTPALVSMESLKNNQASLLKVTPDEYAAIVRLVLAEEGEVPADDPVLPAPANPPCAPYGEADFLREVWNGVTSIDLSTVRWSQLQIGRQTETYGLLLNVCRLVSERALLTEEEGARKLDAWIEAEKAAALFERFLCGYFAVHHPDLRPAARAIRWDTLSNAPTSAPTSGLPSAIIPGMFADLVLTGPERVLVVDAKFYKSVLADSRFEKQKIRSDHLYQVNAYVTNIATAYPEKETAGMLIYAKTEKESVPDTTFRSAGHELSVVTLDLTRDFASIAARLDTIAEAVRGSRGA